MDRPRSSLCSRSILLLAWALLVSSPTPAQGLDPSTVTRPGSKDGQVPHGVRRDASTGQYGPLPSNLRADRAAIGQSTSVGLDIAPFPSKGVHVRDHLKSSCALSLSYLKATFCSCITSAIKMARFGQSTVATNTGSSLRPLVGPINDSAKYLDAVNNLTVSLRVASAPALVGSGSGSASTPGQATGAVPLSTPASTGMQSPDDMVIVTRKLLAARKATRTTSKPKSKKKPAKKLARKNRSGKKKAAPPKTAAKKPTPRKKNEYYECAVLADPDSGSYAWGILDTPMKCVETDQHKYPNYYFACFCTDDTELCKQFADDVDYAVHNPEVNGAYYIGPGKTVEEAREIYVDETCYVDDPSCTSAIDAGVGGLAGCGGD